MRLSQTPPIARGEEYRRFYQQFLRQGSLSVMATNYLVVKRLVLEGNANSFAYGIGCFRCGRISWNPDDVNRRYCSFCRISHDAA